MTEGDIRIRAADLAEAVGFLTRLPVPSHEARGAASCWAWPLAGALVGAIAALAGLAALWAGLPPALAAVIALLVEIVITGALHEDGLADTADGLWGGHDPARRLDIMKDSRIGSYGVLALGLSLLLRWTALAALVATPLWLPALAAAGALSRAPMALAMRALPNARGTGVAAHIGRPPALAATLGAALALAITLTLTGWSAPAAILAAAAAALALALIARAKIGGQTGDILGAMQQAALIAALAAFTAAAK